jgi:transcriptional regulator with XRE-family HTH domain
MTINNNLFIERLKNIMSQRDISQGKLSKYADVSVSSICRYFNKERNLEPKNLIKIAYYLKVNPKYLSGESDDIDDLSDLEQLYNQIIINQQFGIDNRSIWSKRLEQAIKVKGVTQSDLAKVLNISKQAISGYTNDGKEPTYEILCKICEYLNVSSDYLLGRVEINNIINVEIKYEIVLKILRELDLLKKFDENPQELNKFIKILKKAYEIYNL